MSYQLTQQHIPPTQIYLNSKYADMYGGDPSFKSHCFFIFHEPIIKVPQNYKYLISLNNAEIPNSIYNVNGTNNSITFCVDTGSYNSVQVNYKYTITLAPGNYSADEICLLLSNLSFVIDTYDDGSTPSTFTLITTYDYNMNKFLFNITGDTLIPAYSYYVGIYNVNLNPIFGLSGNSRLMSAVNWGSLPIKDGKTTLSLYSDMCVDVTGTRAVFFR